MHTHLTQALLMAGVSFLLATLLFPAFIRVYLHKGWVDKPDNRKKHIKPVPAAGGVVIALSVFGALVMFETGRSFLASHLFETLALLVLCGIGAWDDQRNLRPLMRLLVQLGCGALLSLSGLRLQSLHGVFGVYELAWPAQILLSTVIYAGATNAFNLIDGIDGLSGVLALTGLTVFSILFLLCGSTSMLLLLLPFIAALVLFLKYNFTPASVFMGDSGSQMLGFLLAASGMTILEQGANTTAHPYAALVSAILILPVADALRVFAYRIGSGRSPFMADRSHLHHWLLLAGNNHPSAVKHIFVLQIGILLFSLFTIDKLDTTYILLVQLTMVLLFTRFVKAIARFEKWKNMVRENERSYK
ncbi:MAG: undecaprenyl/decaprenyl-phosphate alpha-N-acetylglucosaminyl 1-phosphate transferase [Bacteroidetes bacterium]|nr:undecaprenyl/decaprenyl-phosphate alpha-N-acetylglucosaminyl 1-phosphate transferase [Bacteroidota bacterium]